MTYASPRARAEMHLVREAVTWAERSLELTDNELGQALGVSSRSIARWRSARNAPSARNLDAAEQLLELAQALTGRFGADRKALHEWLHQPLPALKRRSPLRAIIAGDVARVVTLLANAESGTFA